MITVDQLNAFGADTKSGLARCLNNEEFYLRLVRMELEDKNIERLARAVKDGDTRGAFEAAHALKGTLANLSLTPLFEPVAELTERLRGAEKMVDTGDLLPRILEGFDTLRRMDDRA